MVNKAKLAKAQAAFSKGIEHAQANEYAQAEKCFVKVHDVFPNHYENLNNLALTYLFQGKMVGRAESLLKKAIASKPDFADAYKNITRLYLQQGRLPEAVGMLKRNSEIETLSLEEKKQYVVLLQQIGQFSKAKQVIAMYLAEGNLGHLSNEFEFHYANNCLRLGEYNEAIQYFTTLLNKEFNVITLNNLAMCYLSIGNKDKAESLLRESIKKAPDYTEAYRNISMMKKFKADDSDLVLFREKLNQHGLSDDQRGHLYFALGKAYDDLKEYEMAFAAYEEGNRIIRRQIDFSIEDESTKLQDMRSAFKNIDVMAMSENHEDSYPIPIFIVGMPRSGTSLLEQIFATVGNIAALGELTFVENLMTARSMEKTFLYPNDVSKVSDADWKAYRDQYFEQALKLAKEQNIEGPIEYIVDKQPFNFWHVGIIRKLFPEAKIIHSTRDAMDCSLSNFFQYFYGNLGYSNDLKEIGQYYRLQEKMMEYWKSIYADSIYTVDYQDLVADPKTILLPLFEFLAIEWQDEYLEFYLSKRPVRTMSLEQVRSPIYKGSVERWRNYEPWLSDLKAGLVE